MKKQNEFPPGWDEERVQSVIAYYDQQTEDEAIAEAEMALQNESNVLIEGSFRVSACRAGIDCETYRPKSPTNRARDLADYHSGANARSRLTTSDDFICNNIDLFSGVVASQTETDSCQRQWIRNSHRHQDM